MRGVSLRFMMEAASRFPGLPVREALESPLSDCSDNVDVKAVSADQEPSMSDQAASTPSTPAPAAASSGILPWLVVGITASTIGAALPFGLAMFTSTSAHATDSPGADATGEHGASGDHGSGAGAGHGAAASGGHGSGHGGGHGGDHGKGHGSASGSASPADSAARTSAMVFIPYGDVTVNLDEQRLNRYLRVKLVLHVRRSDEFTVRNAMNEKELLLRNWLVSHLSDKELDEIRGKAGQNMLRREIRDHFNATLFPDHYDRVYDVLFQEFNVQ